MILSCSKDKIELPILLLYFSLKDRMTKQIDTLFLDIIQKTQEKEVLSEVVGEMRENWKLILIVVAFREVFKYSWNKIYLKLGIVDNDGFPDTQKGERIRTMYRTLKKYKNRNLENLKNSKNALETKEDD